MGGIQRAVTLAILAWLWAFGGVADARASDFSDWAVVVVAGDWRASNGRDTEAFDNARRDLSAALVHAGFRSDNIRQYSLRPPRPGDDPAVVVSPKAAVTGFVETARRAGGGCLFYLTSHGTPHGAVFGPKMMLTPAMLDALLSEACADRPTVAVVSACFSGVFVQPVKKPNRMIITAARPDRSSFGCSERDRYPYFDACVLQGLQQTRDFVALSARVRSCVAAREAQEGLTPPSEPQVAMGSQVQLTLPLMRFGGS